MQAERDPLSDRMMPWFYYASLAALAILLLLFLAGQLNLLLGRQRVVNGRFLRWDVQVGRRSNTVTSFFEAAGRSYSLKASKVVPVDQNKDVDLVLDGFVWDEIVELRQGGQTVWRRI